jgi:integrase
MAMRPGEACSIRWADIDRTGEVWLYSPAQHNLAYRNEARIIPLGPKAQAVLAEFPTERPHDIIFSPDRNVEEIRALRSHERKTPKYRSHME